MTMRTAPEMPETLPITTEQYQILIDQGAFVASTGQIELIHGKIVRMNPQGPVHSDPVDELNEWSVQNAAKLFRVRIEKPIEIAGYYSTPEPDVAWVVRRRYGDRHPTAEEIRLLIEVSHSSEAFDRGEKLQLYAEAKIVEYWIVHVASQTIEVFTDPQGSTYAHSTVYRCGDEVHPNCLPQATLAIARLFSKTIE